MRTRTSLGIQMKIIDTLRKHLVELRDRFDPKKVREIKRIRDFKSKKIRVAIYTLIAVFSLGFGLVNIVKQEELSEAMSLPENASDPAKLMELSNEQASIDSSLEELYEEWETLC